ncbi:MAG: hypothetical protein ACYDBB_11730 [Armatimonadota bacterium]
MRFYMSMFGVLVAVVLAMVPAVGAIQRTVTLNEYLGESWTNELIHYPLTFARGELKGLAIARVEINKAAIPSQVSDVVRYDDGSVKSMNVWVQANLPANWQLGLTITPGKSSPADTGVVVKTTPDTIELTTSAPKPVGIRLLNGSKSFDWPIPAAQAPGPIQGLLLPSGRVTGSGKFEVPFNVNSYRAEITATGPLFTEAKVHYSFDTGDWTFTARVVKGSPLILITEELDNGWNDQKAREVDRFYTFTVNGENFKPTQAFYLGRSEKGFNDLLDQVPQPEVKATMGQPSVSGCNANGYTLAFTNTRTDYYLIGWPDWSPRVGVGIRYIEPGKDAVGFISVHTPYWRNQMALRFRATKDGAVQACLPLQVYDQAWETDGYGRTSPNATGKTTDVPDSTARRSYGIMLTPAEDEKTVVLGSLLRESAKFGAWPLDEVKDWTLDWPDPMASTQWAAETGKEGKRMLDRMRGWVALKRATGNFSLYSMHDYFQVSQWKSDRNMGQADLLDIINDPKQLTTADRKTLRRLAAYQAYIINSMEAFPWGTGAHLGNPNMSIMAMEARVFGSKIIQDHPMFKPWGQWSLAFIKEYINRFTRDSGAAYECPSYTLGVTIKQMADANATLLNAGIGDALATDHFKNGIRFTFNWLLPPDLRFSNKRTIMPVGNTSYQSYSLEMATQLTNYFKDRDPELAGQLQWSANQTFPDDKQLKIVKDVVPQLGSAWFKDYGIFMRHGYGTPYETYFFMMAGNCLGHYETTDHMVYTLYAKGQPINLHFGNGYFPGLQRPWLRNGISVDHRLHWAYERLYANVNTAAFMPATEYAHASLDMDELTPPCGEYPVDYGKTDPNPPDYAHPEKMPLMTWHRQVLFVKDEDPKGPNYFVIRDGFAGRPTKPTDDSFWFLANSITRQGDIFHVDGQLKVDMDVFVNSPVNPQVDETPPSYTHIQQPYARMVADDLKYYPGGKRQEKQLALRLKQPAGNGYFVVLYPRLKEVDPAATFTSLGENAVKVVTTLSTDYLLVNAFPSTVKADGIEITGTSVAVRRYKDGKIIVTNSEGAATVTVAGKTITGTGAFSVTIENGNATTKTYADGAKVEVK